MAVTRDSSFEMEENDARVNDLIDAGFLPEGSDWQPHPSGALIITRPGLRTVLMTVDGRLVEFAE